MCFQWVNRNICLKIFDRNYDNILELRKNNTCIYSSENCYGHESNQLCRTVTAFIDFYMHMHSNWGAPWISCTGSCLSAAQWSRSVLRGRSVWVQVQLTVDPSPVVRGKVFQPPVDGRCFLPCTAHFLNTIMMAAEDSPWRTIACLCAKALAVDMAFSWLILTASVRIELIWKIH